YLPSADQPALRGPKLRLLDSFPVSRPRKRCESSGLHHADQSGRGRRTPSHSDGDQRRERSAASNPRRVHLVSIFASPAVYLGKRIERERSRSHTRRSLKRGGYFGNPRKGRL